MKYKEISLVITTIGVIFAVFSYFDRRDSNNSISPTDIQQQNKATNGTVINQNSGNKDSFNTTNNITIPSDYSKKINTRFNNNTKKLIAIDKKQDILIDISENSKGFTPYEKKQIIGRNIKIHEEIKSVRNDIFNDILNHQNNSLNFIGSYGEDVHSTKEALVKILRIVSENDIKINNSIIKATTGKDFDLKDTYHHSDDQGIQKYEDPVGLFMDRPTVPRNTVVTALSQNINASDNTNIQNWVFVGENNHQPEIPPLIQQPSNTQQEIPLVQESNNTQQETVSELETTPENELQQVENQVIFNGTDPLLALLGCGGGDLVSCGLINNK